MELEIDREGDEDVIGLWLLGIAAFPKDL